MYWSQYLEDTGHALQKGLNTSLHILEGAVGIAGTLKGGYELASAAMPYIRGAAAIAPAAALL